jgi:hypothetical protein
MSVILLVNRWYVTRPNAPRVERVPLNFGFFCARRVRPGGDHVTGTAATAARSQAVVAGR